VAQGRGPYRDGGKPTVWSQIASFLVRVEGAGVFTMYNTGSVDFQVLDTEKLETGGVRAGIFEHRPLLSRIMEPHVGQVLRVTVQVETEAEIEE